MVLPIKGLEKSAAISSTLPDIVLISLDTTRPDALSVYGGGYPTPNIDALANRGVRFTEAISTAPLTEPAHLSMLTGQTTLQTGVASNGTFLENQPLFVTHSLRSMGYQTGFVSVSLHARWLVRLFRCLHDDLVIGWSSPPPHCSLDQLVLPAHTLRERRGKTAVDRAMRWRKNHDACAFFFISLIRMRLTRHPIIRLIRQPMEQNLNFQRIGLRHIVKSRIRNGLSMPIMQRSSMWISCWGHFLIRCQRTASSF